MAGPMSAPGGYRDDPRDRRKQGPHGACQDRERCQGPGCRVRTGKTHHKRNGIPPRSQTDLLERMMAELPTSQESAA